MFRDLLQHTAESAHHDFKRAYALDTEKKKDDLVTDVVSMYNATGDRFPSTKGTEGVSSYLILGVEHHPGKSLNYQPLSSRPDEAVVQQIIQRRVRPPIPVLYHDIRIKNDPEIKDGLYGLIEIRKKKIGPAYVLPTNKTKIDPNKLYTRQGGGNINPDDVTEDQRKAVFEQFEFGYDPHSLSDIRDTLEGLGKDVYKIFVVNTAEEEGDPSSDIAKAVAEAQPSMVIDLDHNTRRSGFHKKAKSNLSLNRAFLVKTYQELAGISDASSEMADIAQDKSTLYVLANGCPDARCPKPKKMARSTSDIHHFLRRVFTQMKQPKPVICYYLVRSEADVACMKKLLTQIEDAYDCAQGNMGDGKLLFVTFCAQQRLKEAFSGGRTETYGDEEEDDDRLGGQHIVTCAPMIQVSLLLSDLHSAGHNRGKYTFPGVSGPGFISQEEHVSMSDKVLLFYNGVGHKDLTESEIDDIRLKYLQGGEITPEVLHINNTTKSYVFRSEFHDTLKKLRGKLEQTKEHFWMQKHGEYRNIFSIYHDPSSGGTTNGKALLWDLHQDWPCIEIKSLDDTEGVVITLKLLHRRSQKPLVLLLDHPDFTTPRVQALESRMSNELVKVVIIHIIPISKFSNASESWIKDAKEGRLKDPYHNPSELRWHITSYLGDQDLKGFGDLYKMTEEKRKNTRVRKVFLLALHAFLKHYTRITEHVTTCVNNSTDEEKRLLRMSCMLWQYTRRAIPLALAARVLKMPLPECGTFFAEFEKSDRPLADLLIKTDDGLRPGHALLVEDTLKICSSSHEPDKEEVQRFEDFMSDFLSVVGSEDDRQACVYDIVRYLMIERKNPVHHYSPFVTAHIGANNKKYRDASRTAQDICRLADALGNVKYGAHIRALHARILMYQLGEVAESLEEMNSALAIDNDDCVLHTIKGNLLKERLKGETRASDMDISHALGLAKDAVDAFSKALSVPNTESNYPHIAIGEAQTRVVLLKYVFRTCGNKHVPYLEKVKSHTDSLLRESEAAALRLLDTLDLKLSQYEYDDLNVQHTKELMLEARIDLFKLRCDLNCFERTKKGKIKGLKSHIPAEAACSISYIIRYEQGTGDSSDAARKPRPWHKLSKDELKIIIETLQRQLSPAKERSKLRFCYQDLLRAMVYLRQKNQDSLLQYNVDSALVYAKEWVSKFKKDHEAHFMLGVLTFVRGLEGDQISMNPRPNPHTINQAVQSLKECQRICEGLKTTRNFRTFRYCIGTKGGLSSVIPHYEDIMKKARPRRFTGILRKGRYVTVREVEPAHVEAKVSIKHDDDKLALLEKQQPTIEFSLAISHDTIFAIDVEMCEDDDSDE